MTNRLMFPETWASGGTNVADPDLDTTNPSYVANKYEGQGWISEKPPEEWQNFLSQLTDEKLVELIINMVYYQDASVTYKPKAVVKNGSNVLALVSGGTTKPILDTTADGYTNYVTMLDQQLIGHKNIPHAHNETVDSIIGGTYLKSYVDEVFGSPTSPRTIVYHKLKTGRAHGETPAQVGTLPVGGGIFTGDVSFLSKMLFAGATKSLGFVASQGFVELRSGSNAIALDGAGNVYHSTSSGSYKILRESSWHEFETKNNPDFALPVELMSVYVETELSNQAGVGVWTLETSNSPSFIAGRGLSLSGNTITITKQSYDLPVSIYVHGVDGLNSVVSVVKDYPNWQGTTQTVSNLLQSLGVPQMTHLKYLKVYPQLSDKQKTMLVL